LLSDFELAGWFSLSLGAWRGGAERGAANPGRAVGRAAANFVLANSFWRIRFDLIDGGERWPFARASRPLQPI